MATQAQRNRRRRQRQRRASRGGVTAPRRRRGTRIRPVASTAVQPARRRVSAPRTRRARRSSGVLSDIGSTVGNLVLPGVGGRIGRALGSGIGRIFGSGDYVMSNPVQANSLAGSSPPQFGDASGTTRIRHREYITDVFGTTAFNNTRYSIQPGLSSLFPWLYRIAANYEQYRIVGLVVEYKATSAIALNSTNTALGVVGLVTQYDATEPSFQSKQEAENYIGAQSCSPAQSMLHFVECARGQNPLDRMYVRTSTLTSGDVKFYDLGIVNVFTQGMQAAANIGELWVSYDIEFSKPKLATGGALPNGMDLYNINAVMNGGNYTNGSVVKPRFGTLGTTMSNNVINIPKELPGGNYAIIILAFTASTGSALAGANVTYGGDATALSIFGLTSSLQPFQVTTGSALVQQMYATAFTLSVNRSADYSVTIPFNNIGQASVPSTIFIVPLVSIAPLVSYEDLRLNDLESRYMELASILKQLQLPALIREVTLDNESEEFSEIEKDKSK